MKRIAGCVLFLALAGCTEALANHPVLGPMTGNDGSDAEAGNGSASNPEASEGTEQASSAPAGAPSDDPSSAYQQQLLEQLRQQQAAGGNNASGSSSRVEQHCYEHNCNGAKTGRKCFDNKQAYCNSMCAESNCVSRQACSSECS